ncbi:flagellar basal body protein FliL [Rhodobacteraceae bacterium IMCC1335]
MPGPSADPSNAHRSRLRITAILSLLLALSFGIAAFFLTQGTFQIRSVSMGILGALHTSGNSSESAFIELDPFKVSIGDASTDRHLLFAAQLDVPRDKMRQVIHLKPRITDVLNTYLRALDLDDVRHPAALTKLRGQILRRVQLIVGDDNINDLLIMNFLIK